MFLEKYPHLNNYKNRGIIYKMCEIVVMSMPEYIETPNYYINFIKSSIEQIE
jgi:hypothetical protein